MGGIKDKNPLRRGSRVRWRTVPLCPKSRLHFPSVLPFPRYIFPFDGYLHLPRYTPAICTLRTHQVWKSSSIPLVTLSGPYVSHHTTTLPCSLTEYCKGLWFCGRGGSVFHFLMENEVSCYLLEVASITTAATIPASAFQEWWAGATCLCCFAGLASLTGRD